MVVALAVAGEEEAFAELVRRRQSFVRQLLRRLARNSTVADDLAQQVFLQAWRSLRTLREPAAFGGWLRRLAVNAWLQHVRRERIALTLDDAPQLASLPMMTAERVDLDDALAQLPAGTRLCVVLAYGEGMSHGEIASATGLPLGTVKSHIQRGAARLRLLLADYGSTK
jgi:RNA polymerase sigma-70 factor (ECF subfamily)